MTDARINECMIDERTNKWLDVRVDTEMEEQANKHTYKCESSKA